MLFLTTLFEFIFPFYLMALIILGFAQPLGAIIRLLTTKKGYSMYAIGLRRYLLAVVVYFTIDYVLLAHMRLTVDSWFLITYLFVVPAFFAVWYIRHIWRWHFKWKRIDAFNRSNKGKNLEHTPPELREPAQEVKIDGFPVIRTMTTLKTRA